jgi:Lipase maturation factor
MAEPAPIAPVAAEDLRLTSSTHWLTRFLFFRLLGLVYAVAFLVVLRQWEPLLGAHGLLPAHDYLEAVRRSTGSVGGGFLRLPSLFWLSDSDAAFRIGGWAGFAAALALLAGLANVPLLAGLWFLYMSFVHAGGLFYGYGWEILLLEAGFLAIFLAPLWRLGPFDVESPPSPLVITLLRWLTFRMMLGAGLIKLRGDPCWRELTCLVWHYETQPNPNPLSWYLHQLPPWVHRLEVAFNHLVELVAPWFYFGPRHARRVAGLLTVLFQVLLIVSGNLSFLNWQTIAVAVACLDDGFLQRLVPRAWTAALARRVAGAQQTKPRAMTVYALAAGVAFLSLNPVLNMLSPGQVMNTSFDPFDLVNTYGAFGSIGRERFEIVLEGTSASEADATATWREYEFVCKPGDPRRRPCWISPYHHRLDWQMWFAAMPGAGTEPWLVHFVAKLLEGDPAARGLLARDPFGDSPPRFVRARYYRYRLTARGDPSGAWWSRELVGEYLPALSRDDPRLVGFLSAQGWR